MNQPTYDSVWKALPDVLILALARLVVPNIGPNITPWKTDLKVLFDRDIDNAYLVEVNGELILLLLEYQNYLDATMALRIFHYVALLKLQYFQQNQQDITVLPIVIWAVKGKLPAPVYASALTEDTGITCRYREIQLGELDWQSVDPILLVLAPYLRGVERANLQAIALRMYAAAPPEQRALLLGAFLNISKRTFHDIDEIEQAILQEVRLTMDLIFEAIADGPIGIKLIERGKAEGIAEGKAEGIAEGKEQGKAQGIAEGIVAGEAKGKTEGLQGAVAILWQGRFGALPPEIEAALQQSTPERLQQVLMAFAGTASEMEIRALLGS